MERRRLGRTGPEVSAIGLGCLSLSDYYGAHEAVDIADVRRLVEHAIALGVTLFDTAAMYGRSEDLLGQAIKGLRRGLLIATKFGVLVDEHGRPRGIDASPAAVRQACDDGLKRLGIDVIDLFYLHRVDRAVAIEETVGAMAELVRDGKVRHIGLCEVSVRTLRRAQKVHPIAALQSEYSLWSRDVEPEILPTCRELGVGFVAYSPLGRGFLTGAVTGADSLPTDDARRAIPRFQGDNLTRNVALLNDLRAIAAHHGATPAQVALGWLLAQGTDIVPIPGTKRMSYLNENVGAARLQLSADEVDGLGRVFAPDRISGERYGAAARAFVDD